MVNPCAPDHGSASAIYLVSPFLLVLVRGLCYLGSMMRVLLLGALACGLAGAAEHFEKQPAGGFSQVNTQYGRLTAAGGHAEINRGHGRNSAQALRLLGGQEHSATLQLVKPLEDDTTGQCWVERWTRRNPFAFRILAITPAGEKEVARLDKSGVGGYHNFMKWTMPAGTTGLRFEATTAEGGGVLIDDLNLMVGPMVVKSVGVRNPGAFPIMKRAVFNPVLAVDVQSEGAHDPKSVELVTCKVSDPAAVAGVTLRSGSADGLDFSHGTAYGTAVPLADGTVRIPVDAALEGGSTHLWLDVQPAASAAIGSSISFSDVKVTIEGKEYTPEQAPVTQRVGTMLAFPGDNVGNQPAGAAPRHCVAFRIPGLIRTAAGSLIACFDARYHHEGDLCADIDVATVRSTDGGQSWTMPEVSMDAGPGHNNGCGDPCILQDQTGRIWMQSLVCHFSGGASLWVSKTGWDKDKTGQWGMVYSDDDGKTWSKDYVNPTRQIKKEQWTTILAGPGNGIVLKNGTIVFPAQIWDRAVNPRCMSTICYSTDGGKNWAYGNGVPHATSECQVVELQDGSIMINCRNEAYQGNRIVYVTRDLGKTWQPHETNNKALSEPTCQGSIIAVDSAKYGRLLLFSNPRINGRSNMTVRVSKDDGKTWNTGLLYDTRRCMGYSCQAMVDDDHVGIIYETSHTNGKTGNRGIGFIILPITEILNAR